LFPGVAVIFMIDHTLVTSSLPSSPGRSIQVQVIGRCLNLTTLSTEDVKSTADVRPLDMAWFRLHISATVTRSHHNQIPFLACSQQLVKRQCPCAHQMNLRRANCAVPINNPVSNSRPLAPSHITPPSPPRHAMPCPLSHSSSPSLECFA
jgi:hypothetical protein